MIWINIQILNCPMNLIFKFKNCYLKVLYKWQRLNLFKSNSGFYLINHLTRFSDGNLFAGLWFLRNKNHYTRRGFCLNAYWSWLLHWSAVQCAIANPPSLAYISWSLHAWCQVNIAAGSWTDLINIYLGLLLHQDASRDFKNGVAFEYYSVIMQERKKWNR